MEPNRGSASDRPGRQPEAEPEIKITEEMIDRAAHELWFFSEIESHDARRAAARSILLAAAGRPIDHDEWLSR
jgi:hypothetical protein